MHKYGFVILHYLTDQDTIKCVESIINTCNTNDYCIAIVDNFSNNGSIEKIEEKYKSVKNIYFLKNSKNLGFAKGNNVGYEFCKKELKCTTIIVLNNDTILNSKNILEQIELDETNYHPAIIGPDIQSMIDGGHQNPMKKVLIDRRIIKKQMRKYRMLLLINKVFLYDIIKKSGGKKETEKSVQDFESEYKENCYLHGSFVIFTKRFIEQYDYAFYPETFLYNEELILKKICENGNLKTLYDPNIKVLHKEDSSTNVLTKNNNRKKRSFVFKNLINSYKVLLKFY